jgi:hypothetical protein
MMTGPRELESINTQVSAGKILQTWTGSWKSGQNISLVTSDGIFFRIVSLTETAESPFPTRSLTKARPEVGVEGRGLLRRSKRLVT